MKRLLAITLMSICTAAYAAVLVSETVLPDGTRVCVYSDGSTIRTKLNNCPSIK